MLEYIGLVTIGVSVSGMIVEVFPVMSKWLSGKKTGYRTGPKVKTIIHVREEKVNERRTFESYYGNAIRR